MAHMRIDGPVEIGDKLAQMLFEAMTEVGQSGVAQMFAARLMSGPLSDKAVEAAAKVYMERAKIPQAGAKALREGIAAKCRTLGEGSVNPEHLKILLAEGMKNAVVEIVKERVDEIFAAMPADNFVAAAAPGVGRTVERLTERYFLETQAGQTKIMEIIDHACENGRDHLNDIANNRLDAIVDPKIKAKRPVGRPRKLRT